MKTGFQECLALKQRFEKAVDDADRVIKKFPRGPMGMVPDNVKLSPEFQAAKLAYDTAFSNLRWFNASFLKQFKKEYGAYMRNKRENRLLCGSEKVEA